MTSLFIPVANANAENLKAPNPPKEYTLPPPKTEKYTRTYLQYGYSTAQGTALGEPIFELSKTKANIKKKVKDNKATWKLNLTLHNEADIKGCMQLDLGIRHVVHKYKGQFKQFSFTVENPGNLNGTFFYSRDDAGNIIDGTSPIMSFKFDDKSIFKKLNFVFDEAGAPIIDPSTGLPRYTEESVDYKLLEDMNFECGLTFSLRDLYQTGGAMPLPQLFVRTCWILSAPTQRGAVDSKHSAVLKNFLQGANAEELSTLMAVVDKIKSGQSDTTLLESDKSIPQGLPSMPAATAQPPASPPTQQAPTQTIDLTAFMNPQQSSQPPPQMPTGYPQQYGQPQVSVARI